MTSICILSLDATRRGGEGVYTAGLAVRLAQRGHRVTVLCQEASDEVQRHCEVKRLAKPKPDRDWGLWRLAAALQVRDYRRQLTALRLEPSELVIGSAEPLLRAYYQTVTGVPLIYVPHSLVAPLEVASYPTVSSLQRRVTVWVYDRLQRWSLNQAAFTIRFTETACDALRDHYGKRVQARFEVLPIPVTIPPAGARNGICRPVRLLSVGRLVQTKNLDFLLRGLGARKHLDWRLDIVGDGEERAPLEGLCRQIGLADRVRFHGHCDDVVPHYRNADLFVFPSRLENSPLVLLEAMSHGLPSLSLLADGSRYVNANHELVCDGRDGFLAKSEGDFWARLETLLREPDRLRGVGDRARETVCARNAWDRHLDRLQRLIAEACMTTQTQLLKAAT